jgi:hypothetical protein
VNGIKQQYPSDSLVRQDFKRINSLEFKARAVTGADKIGTASAWNRIHTDPTLATGRTVKDLEDWWYTASRDQRFKLLVKESRAPTESFGGYTGKLSAATLLDTIGCPFQEADGVCDSD